MRTELLTIGDELLDGRVTDTNGARLGRRLWGLGVGPVRRATVPDDVEEIAAALKTITERSDLCICTGGLGPTSDDLTLDAVARFAGVDRVPDAEAWSRIVARFGGRPVSDTNRRQAQVPRGCTVLQTEVGTAPGIAMRLGRCQLYALPGVPDEMIWHFERYVRPFVGSRLSEIEAATPTMATATHSRVLRFANIAESRLAQLVEALDLPSTVHVAYRTRIDENQIRLRAAQDAVLGKASALIAAAAGKAYVGADETGLLERLLEICRDRGITLGAAESCTGGLLGAQITDVAGASQVFRGSIVSYANAVKTGVLDVPSAILDTKGAVSEACAEAMAKGARNVLGCDVGIAVTGIAGPGGGTPQKPVGTVCFGWAGWGLDATETLRFPGSRTRVRMRAVVHALDHVRRSLEP